MKNNSTNCSSNSPSVHLEFSNWQVIEENGERGTTRMIPRDSDLPKAVHYEYPFASYNSETQAAEHTLHYSRTYELKDVRVPLEKLEDLKHFFRDVADDEHAYSILKVP